MCHSEADEELWESDPHEYISQKFGIIYILNNLFYYLVNIFIITVSFYNRYF